MTETQPVQPQKKTGCWIAAAVAAVVGLFFLFIGLVFAAIAIPNFMEARVRAKVARTKADMRSLATGLEAYMVDQEQYPEKLYQITTPVPFLPRVPTDVFTDGSRPIAYERIILPDRQEDNQRYVMWSVGPDEELTLDPRTLEQRVEESPFDMEEAFINVNFDPTNGTYSHGDIFRMSH